MSKMRCIYKFGGVGWSKSDIIYWVGSSESEKIGDGLVGRSKMTLKNRISYLDGPWGKWKILKKHSVIFIWQIGLTQGFSTINFHFFGHLVWKIEKLMNKLPTPLCLRWQNYLSIFIFQTRRLLENRKIIVSKPFVHTKFDKTQKNTIS